MLEADERRNQQGVVLLAEDVDRNDAEYITAAQKPRSSSSRRTWIEIYTRSQYRFRIMSSSSRRTWIEIYAPTDNFCKTPGRPPRGGRG